MNITPKVISDLKSFFVVLKPSGWIVNSSESAAGQLIIQDWIKENFDYEISQNDELRNGVVHRLDKETSGVLLVAKTEKAMLDLQRQFKERIVHKKYITLVHGKVSETHGLVQEPIGRLPWNRRRFGVFSGGRESSSEYSVLSYYKKGSEILTLVEVFPKTGRTHQIRVHMKHIGHPVVSDTFYAGRKTSRKDRVWCERMFLHSSQITVEDPDTKKQVTVKSELPEDLQAALDTLEKV